MANLRKSLEAMEELYGEPIEAMVVGKHDDRYFDDAPLPDENVILSREDGLRKVDQNYDNGYGGADCYPLFAWTATRVFFVSEYDGATDISYTPRNPMAIEPQFSGRTPWFDEIEKRKEVAALARSSIGEGEMTDNERELFDSIVYGLRSQGWARIEAEGEALERIERLRDKPTVITLGNHGFIAKGGRIRWSDQNDPTKW